jgi:hypothetical protein
MRTVRRTFQAAAGGEDFAAMSSVRPARLADLGPVEMRGVSKRTQHIGRTLEISRIVRLVKTVFFFAPGRIATLTIAPGRMGCLVFSALRVHRPNILGPSRSRVVLDVSAARGTQAVCQRLRDFKSASQIGFTNRLQLPRLPLTARKSSSRFWQRTLDRAYRAPARRIRGACYRSLRFPSWKAAQRNQHGQTRGRYRQCISRNTAETIAFPLHDPPRDCRARSAETRCLLELRTA